MPSEEEMDNMPIWQDHERRITTLENTFTNMSQEVRDVKKTVEESSNEQKKLLNTLIEHHLSTSKMKLSNFWKVLLNITGAGGVITAVVYAAVQIFQATQ